MIAICDFCMPDGDHDKPYRYGARLVELKVRFTRDEWRALIAFRRHIDDVRDGYPSGRAFGDLSTDDPECPSCHQQLHVHEPMRLCGAN